MDRPALSPLGWVISAAGMILCVGAADYVTRTELSLVLFYLAPIGLGTWFASARAGAVLAAMSAVVTASADIVWAQQHPASDPGTGTLLWNAFMLLGTALSLVVTLGALQSRLEAMQRLARTDALTGIPNRRAFFEAAERELERVRRHGRPLTVAYVDLDDFKRVNDQLGHAEGDALLATVARTLRGATRTVDTVARLGGDEFGLLLPEADAATARAALDRLGAVLWEAMSRHGEVATGVSVGAAVFLSPPASVDELTARADELMYVAKRTAKGSVRLGVFDGAQVFATAVT
jgi:diguanylate cyclase (GGDEF)-like protein